MWKYYDYKCKACGHVEERLVSNVDEPQKCEHRRQGAMETSYICGSEMEREMPAVHVTPEWQVPMGR